jgi:hypothetical protein
VEAESSSSRVLPCSGMNKSCMNPESYLIIKLSLRSHSWI